MKPLTVLFSLGVQLISIVLFSEKAFATGNACIVRFVDGETVKHGDCSQHDVTAILKDIRRMAANEATQGSVSACAANPCDANASCQDTTDGQHVCKCKDGFAGDGQTCTLIKNTKQDILFLIQNGGSVGSVNFKKLLQFTQAVVNTFCGGADVGQDKTRISVHSYGAGELSHILFNEFLTKTELLKRIGSISYKDAPASLCCLNKSLEYAKDNLFTSANGARMADEDVKKEVFVFSDGSWQMERNATASSESRLGTSLMPPPSGLKLQAARQQRWGQPAVDSTRTTV